MRDLRSHDEIAIATEITGNWAVRHAEFPEVKTRKSHVCAVRTGCAW